MARKAVELGGKRKDARHGGFWVDYFCSGAYRSCMDTAGQRSPVDIIADATAQFGGRPSWDDYFMATAMLLSTRSPCERLHVGCVIVSGGTRANRIIAAGYNGYLPGASHTSRVRDGHEQATVHAEQNSVADAARRGSSLEGCIAYVTHYPCINCAKILAAAGIAEVRYRVDYKNDPIVAPLLEEAGVKVLQLT